MMILGSNLFLYTVSKMGNVNRLKSLQEGTAYFKYINF